MPKYRNASKRGVSRFNRPHGEGVGGSLDAGTGASTKPNFARSCGRASSSLMRSTICSSFAINHEPKMIAWRGAACRLVALQAHCLCTPLLQLLDLFIEFGD
jgi:hypothetical protein